MLKTPSRRPTRAKKPTKATSTRNTHSRHLSTQHRSNKVKQPAATAAAPSTASSSSSSSITAPTRFTTQTYTTQSKPSHRLKNTKKKVVPNHALSFSSSTVGAPHHQLSTLHSSRLLSPSNPPSLTFISSSFITHHHHHHHQHRRGGEGSSPNANPRSQSQTNTNNPQTPSPNPQLNFAVNNHSLKQNRSGHHHSSSAFRSTTPQKSPARILALAGLLGILFGARYIAKAGLAFYQAYKNTNKSFEPVGEEDILEAHNELVQSAEEVTALAEQQDQEIAIKKQKAEDVRVRVEKEKRLKEAGLDGFDDIGSNKPKFIQDDFSDHIDTKARDARRKLEHEAELKMIRFESNEAEIEMNEIFYRTEPILRGDGSGFAEPATNLVEAEQILQIQPNACLEELRERHNVMMRLNHPDLGGSPYLALKISEAFELLKPGAKSNPVWVRKRQEQKDAEDAVRKQHAEEMLKEQLIKEGVLDNDGEFKHPDGNSGKKHDKE